MEKRLFPNPRLILPVAFKENEDRLVTFDAIDNYLDLVGDYIYTGIRLDGDPSGPDHVHAWIQKILSASILRSLYIRNAFVVAFNTRNTIGMFLPLKAWFEVVGYLASIHELITRGYSTEELHEKLHPYVLGNRGKGQMRVGSTEAVNVITMLEKADAYLQSLNRAGEKNESTERYFTDFYDMASNPSHPSYDAHEMMGDFQGDGIWSLKTSDQIKNDIIATIPAYGGLLMSALMVQSLCQKIINLEDGHFNRLGSSKFFVS